MFSASAPEEPVDMLPFPKGFAPNGFGLELSDDRLWIHTYRHIPQKEQRIAMTLLSGHATTTAEFPRVIRWFKPAPSGPRGLARADTGALYLVDLPEAGQ